MRWNPFRRTLSDEVSESQFESTVVGEAGRLVGPGTGEGMSSSAPAPAPAAEAPAASAPASSSMSRPPSAIATPANIVDAPSIGHIGRYALKTILGEGGLGTVYAAWDPLLSRTVAVKTLHIDADPAARDSLDTLFLNEARAAAGLSHPHIVTVFDAGPGEGGVYIAMERLQGQDLRHLLQQGHRPSPIEAAQLVRRVADALAYAHRKGVIHCDVKPANIFMVGRTHPKVLDFGIARVAHRENSPHLEGMVAGSPYYLAPEQLDGGSVDRRSDVYSLGVVLYELLCGKKPFEGRSLEEITRHVRTADVEPAHRVSPKVPIGLSVIAGRAMARKPDQRYPSARHLSMELRHWIESAEARALMNGTRKSAAEPPPWRRPAWVALPLLGVLAVGGVVWLKTTGSPADAGAQGGAASAPAPAAAVAPVAAAPAASIAASAAPAMVTESADTASGAAAAGAADASRAAAATPGSPAASTPAELRAYARAEAKRKKAAAAASAALEAPPVAVAPQPGVVQFAINPWGQVEVDGQAMGTSPPLTRLTLSAGSHTITVRNADYPAFVTTLTVDAEHPATLRHRFGN